LSGKLGFAKFLYCATMQTNGRVDFVPARGLHFEMEHRRERVTSSKRPA
jgi:hypothetical protein